VRRAALIRPLRDRARRNEAAMACSSGDPGCPGIGAANAAFGAAALR
jgi:hypothetical protein